MSDALEAAFVAEFAALTKQTQRLVLSMTPLEAWCLLACVQLACRHPDNTGPTRAIAERIARQFQQRIAGQGALAIVAERGWHTEFDQ
ncbi:MAG TPA: hypothetical protein VF909_20245 [Roseiflexaceae bacterium]